MILCFGNYRLVPHKSGECWAIQQRTSGPSARWKSRGLYPDTLRQAFELLPGSEDDQRSEARVLYEETLSEFVDEYSRPAAGDEVVCVGYRLVPDRCGESEYFSLEKWHHAGGLVHGGRGDGKVSKQGWRPVGKYPRTLEQGLGYVAEYVCREQPGELDACDALRQLRGVLIPSAEKTESAA